MISVFSENPENDLWRELLQFSYEANINRYLSKKGLHANGETINCIVGSFLQADEYYRAAKDANLQISPLLLYYGTIKTDEPRTLDFSGVRGFLVTNVCIVQRSAA